MNKLPYDIVAGYHAGLPINHDAHYLDPDRVRNTDIAQALKLGVTPPDLISRPPTSMDIAPLLTAPLRRRRYRLGSDRICFWFDHATVDDRIIIHTTCVDKNQRSVRDVSCGIMPANLADDLSGGLFVQCLYMLMLRGVSQDNARHWFDDTARFSDDMSLLCNDRSSPSHWAGRN